MLWLVHTKITLQPTDFRLASNWLQTGKLQLGYIGIAWFYSHQILEPEASLKQSVAILIWCEWAFRDSIGSILREETPNNPSFSYLIR